MNAAALIVLVVLAIPALAGKFGTDSRRDERNW